MRALLDFSKYKELLESMEDSKRDFEFKYGRAIRNAFREEANVLFHDHQELQNFSWNQASSPENDYDFFVNRLDVNVNGIDVNSLDQKHELFMAAKDVYEFIELFDDSDM